MKERSQRKDVLNYLREHQGLTQLEAYKVFPAPVTRLSAIICDLRKQGYDIESVDITGKNCYGRYDCVRYELNKERGDQR